MTTGWPLRIETNFSEHDAGDADSCSPAESIEVNKRITEGLPEKSLAVQDERPVKEGEVSLNDDSGTSRGKYERDCTNRGSG
jgi:hypothetical protein